MSSPYRCHASIPTSLCSGPEWRAPFSRRSRPTFRFALVGDISEALATSTALRAFVHESNQTGQTLFVNDRDELAQHL